MEIKKIETMQDCIEQIEMSEYECIGGYLKNNTGFIKLKELVKNLTIPVVVESLKDVYKREFRAWVKDNFTRYGNVYIDKEGNAHKEQQLESKYKTQLMLHIL
jgi:hypothetical protein